MAIKLDVRETELLRSVHNYVDTGGVAFSGHHMILLLAKIDTERQRLRSLLENVSDVLDENNYQEIRNLLAENFSERD